LLIHSGFVRFLPDVGLRLVGNFRYVVAVSPLLAEFASGLLNQFGIFLFGVVSFSFVI